MTRHSELFVVVLLAIAPIAAVAGETPEQRFLFALSSDDGLRAQGMDYQIQQVDFFSRQGKQSSFRFWHKEYRWVDGDPRRGADGGTLTYVLDEDGAAGGKFSIAAVMDVVDRAAATWIADKCLRKTDLLRVAWDGSDITLFDHLLGVGELGAPWQADVAVAGFSPEMVELMGDEIVAFSVTFVFVDGSGEPTDLDRDGHLDSAYNEIYLNPTVDWSIGGGDDSHDLETVMLHELGHALGLGHKEAPPHAVMNPSYAGVRRELGKVDHAALCTVYAGG